MGNRVTWLACSTALVALLGSASARAALVKVQFDLTNQATAYAGTVSPGHATGVFTGSETVWNRIIPAAGSITGFTYADGSAAPGLVAQLGQPFTTGYQGPPGDSSWNYGNYVNSITNANGQGYAIYATTLMTSMLWRNNNTSLGLRLQGLPPAEYSVFVIAANPHSATSLDYTYSVSLGTNLEQHVASPVTISAGAGTSTWVDGGNYLLGTVTVTGAGDWLSVIVGGANTPVINGIQIAQVEVPEPAACALLLAGGALARMRRRR